jgi:hypothetical protein
MNVEEARALLKQASAKTYPISRALTSPLGSLISGGLSGGMSGALATARRGVIPEAIGIGSIIGAIAGMFGSGSARKGYARNLAEVVRGQQTALLPKEHLEVIKAIEKSRLKVAAYFPLVLAPSMLNHIAMTAATRRALLGRVAKGGGSMIQSERDLVKLVQSQAKARIVRKAALATAAVGATGAVGYGVSKMVAADTES